MPLTPAGEADLRRLSDLIDRWTQAERATNDVVLDVHHEPSERRWYVRLKGEEKSVITVWLTLRERTLHYETYVMPAPEENVEHTYEYLLRCNPRLHGMAFALGVEDAVFLVGQLPVHVLDEDELDRIVGSSYAYVEQHFPVAMQIGYASRYRRGQG